LLDVHAPGRGADGQEGAVGPIEQEGEVVLLRDRAGLLDQDLVDRVALEVHAEDLGRLTVGVRRVLGELHATRLAATTRLDLRLYHDASAELLCRLPRFIRGVRDDAAGHRDAVGGEEFLRLMFEQVHEGPSLLYPAVVLRVSVGTPGSGEASRPATPAFMRVQPSRPPDTPGHRVGLRRWSSAHQNPQKATKRHEHRSVPAASATPRGREPPPAPNRRSPAWRRPE